MKVINTKVNDYAVEQLNKLCHKHGLTHHDLLKNMCDVLIRYMSDKHNLTPDLEQMMSVFEHLEGWKDAFTLCDTDSQPEVVAAIYFVQDTTGKKGIRPMWVEKPYFGTWIQDVNVPTMVEKFFCLTAPDLYKRLRAIGVERDCKTIFETVFTLCSMYGADAYDRMFREEFEDADRSEFGLKPHEGTPFRRKQRKSIDSLENDLNFKPHGGEW